MIIEAYLALVLGNVPTEKPVLLEGFKSASECRVAAEKANRTIVELRTNKARVDGAEVVCLEVKRVGY